MFTQLEIETLAKDTKEFIKTVTYVLCPNCKTLVLFVAHKSTGRGYRLSGYCICGTWVRNSRLCSEFRRHVFLLETEPLITFPPLLIPEGATTKIKLTRLPYFLVL